jgi:hypothetical protein
MPILAPVSLREAMLPSLPGVLPGVLMALGGVSEPVKRYF